MVPRTGALAFGSCDSATACQKVVFVCQGQICRLLVNRESSMQRHAVNKITDTSGKRTEELNSYLKACTERKWQNSVFAQDPWCMVQVRFRAQSRILSDIQTKHAANVFGNRTNTRKAYISQVAFIYFAATRSIARVCATRTVRAHLIRPIVTKSVQSEHTDEHDHAIFQPALVGIARCLNLLQSHVLELLQTCIRRQRRYLCE